MLVYLVECCFCVYGRLSGCLCVGVVDCCLCVLMSLNVCLADCVRVNVCVCLC